MAQTTGEKLGIRAGSKGALTGRPITDAASLGLADLVVAAPAERAAVVILAADSVSDVINKAQSAYDSVAEGGRFWIAYQKGANRKVAAGEEPPLHRDTLQAALAELGLDGVTLIALNDAWSAMRVKSVR